METIKLIQPAPVVRDENGMYQHPDMPDFEASGRGAGKSKTGSA
ncbi:MULTISPECIES: hypothetical protein [Pseudomonas]|nr:MULTISPECIES: hypothetical protein [Pseudomonas]